MGKFFKTASHDMGVGSSVKDINPSCPHYGAKGKVVKAYPHQITFIVSNKGGKYKPGDKLTKTIEQMEKTSGLKMHDWEYLKYLARHKYHMLGPGREIGVPWKVLLKHDLDKFQPNRFRQYSDWFYGPTGLKGTQDPALRKRWRETVDTHYANNPHHAHKIGVDQPLDNQLEALTDWYSVGRSNKQTTLRFADWYKQRRESLPITDEARMIADKYLGGLHG